MLLLGVGLVLFLGIHSVRVFADDTRKRLLATWGEGKWKGLYSLVSAIGFGLLIYGYRQARLAPVVLWTPPLWTRHLALLLMLPFFALLAAVYIPGTRIKASLGHPMVLSVKLWALVHLCVNGNAADVMLFGGFLAWAVLDYISLRRRDRKEGRIYGRGPISRDLGAVAVGLVGWAAFVFYLHQAFIGVALI